MLASPRFNKSLLVATSVFGACISVAGLIIANYSSGDSPSPLFAWSAQRQFADQTQKALAASPYTVRGVPVQLRSANLTGLRFNQNREALSYSFDLEFSPKGSWIGYGYLLKKQNHYVGSIDATVLRDLTAHKGKRGTQDIPLDIH